MDNFYQQNPPSEEQRLNNILKVFEPDYLKTNLENQQKNQEIKELKSDLFWYNLILFFWLLSLILKIVWIIKKYQTGELLIWKVAILASASLSFLCYFWMRRVKISKKLKKIIKSE